MKIDIDRCVKAMQQIDVSGAPTGQSRFDLIEEAISAIQADPKNALCKQDMGIKNYASFGDQRSDHSPGMGPTHGSIVFRISRTERSGTPLNSGECSYLLECVRDFGCVEVYDKSTRQTRRQNLLDVIRNLKKAESDASTYRAQIDAAVVHTHSA